MLGLSYSSELNWVSHVVTIATTASKKIGAWTGSQKFPPTEVVFYLLETTSWSCMEFCCYILAGASSCWTCWISFWNRYMGLFVINIAASLESLAHSQLKTGLGLYYRYDLKYLYLNWLHWFCVLFLLESLFSIQISCMIFQCEQFLSLFS